MSNDKKESVKQIIDFWHRTLVHYALWFSEVNHQMGEEKALNILNDVFKQSFSIQMNRLSKVMGFEMIDDLPKPLLDLDIEKLNEIRDATAVNWLANDGVWFQAVEFKHGMNDAKRCNDSCWGHFSPFEAHTIKKALNLRDHSGLEGLKKALSYRLYACVNEQEIVEEKEKSFVFRMKKCRVQAARNRKGLDDYPCKSGGLVEYTTFADSIDRRIKTECIACPPDKHPEEWVCAWRFSIED
jgi:hypothetical protein